MPAYQCVAPGCSKVGKKKCSKYGITHYYSPECQNSDGKKHKKECARLAMRPGGDSDKEVFQDK